MGMLDRLLGDLVASSTNLPPHVTRGLVRKAGGSKLLIAGGAALAGAMIAQHLHSRQAQGAAQPVVPPPPPPGPGPHPGLPPPPLPGAAPGPAAGDLGWAPPPLPPELAGGGAATPPAAAEGSEEGSTTATAEEVELPAGLLFPVVRTMVAAALADGELEPAEREAIFGHLESGELTPSETQQVRRDLVLPATPGELAAMVAAPEHGELLYRFAFLTLRADGELEPHEAAWLGKLAEALAIGPADRGRLQAELGLDAR